MEGFPGGPVDHSQLHSTMVAVENACASIQVHVNPTEAENLLVMLHKSPMPYQSCRYILENSQSPNARFQAAAAIGHAAVREWEVLTDDNRRNLILFCLCYAMDHATADYAYVQSKVASVAAQLVKRGWLEFVDAEKAAIFSEVKQAVLGAHGISAQFMGINFLESLVSEFSPSTLTDMALPAEFHEKCQSALELTYLKEFYCWAQAAALGVSDKLVGGNMAISEDKACSAALRLMFQILNWNFKHISSASHLSNSKTNSCNNGIRHEASLLKKFERSLVQPGPMWHDTLVSSGHTVWLLNLYSVLRQKYSSDVIWVDSPLAVSARQLIIQLCSLAGTVFPFDNGCMQTKHLLQILSAVIQWIEPLDSVLAAVRSGGSESEMIDGCHVLLSMATLTSAELFDSLLRSLRPFGTIHMLSILTCEVVKADVVRVDEEETWTSDALDILMETWNLILVRPDTEKNSISTEGLTSLAQLFNTIVESLLQAAGESAFDDNENENFVASISKRDERLESYALIARAAADVTVPYLVGLFSQRCSLLSQNNDSRDPTHTMEELYWLLLITAHVLTDSGEGETSLIPQALQASFPDASDGTQHPVVVLSWSIIDFARWSLDPKMRTTYFSPRLMEAVIWFFARWVDTYLMPPDNSKSQINAPHGENGNGQPFGSQSRQILHSFAGEHNQGRFVLDIVVRICMITLTSYPGEIELQALTCQKLLAALTRRKNVCVNLVALDSWRELTKAFSTEKTLFPITARLQRFLAEALVCAAVGMKDLEASNQYIRDLMGPTTRYIVGMSARNDLTSVAQQADIIYMVNCMLERLRGAARATQPRTQKSIFEMGHAVMNPLLALLEAYKNQPAVVYLILKFVVDLVDGQVAFLSSKDTSILVSFCLQLLKIYSSQNLGMISLSLSISLRSEAQAEKYKDLRALLQLLRSICSKDLIDFSSVSDEADSPDIAQVIYVGLHIVGPLISLDLLRYPKLNFDYFALVSHMLEVYPQKVAQLNREAFAQIVGTLDFGIQHQDSDVVEMCLKAVDALASYHYKEKSIGQAGLGEHAIGSNGKMLESILSHFLRILLQLVLFEGLRIDLAGPAADALLPLLLCEQELYQRLVQEFLENQPNPGLKTRLARALHSLTSSNQLSSSLDRSNRHRFRKNFHQFLTEMSGLRTK